MPWKSALRAFLLAEAALFANVSLASPLAAQAEAQVDYDLPAQPLGDTLHAIAQLSGREILFAPEAVQGRLAPAVKGQLSLDEAIRTALARSPLVAEHRSGAVIIKAKAGEALPDPIPPPGSGAITVTGTRIRGVGSVSPVIVATRRSLEQAGINDLADFTRVLPQNYTGGQNRGIAGGGEQGGQQNLNNSATLNLRGLGPDATLTLLNGHRLSYDALDQGIDISAIPLSAIERVEIVADGASALYGSDAVAGVANIVLRRDYRGLETTARIGGTTDGGDFQQEFSIVGGDRWSSGGFMVALDESGASPIYADQRDYARTVDPSLTLSDRNRQWSGVVSGHQQIAPGLSLELDGNVMDRRSIHQNPFLPTADVHISGIVSKPHVRSFALTPTLRGDLGRWQASLSATIADSRTLLDATNYSGDVRRHGHLLYDDKLKGAELSAEGPLVALPGGDARLAVGGGLRRVSLHDRNVFFINGEEVTTQDFTESRSVQFAFGELSLPLVGPGTGIPLVDRLSLSGALRYEHWNEIAAVTTPKLGLIYQPVSDVTMRLTWGKSFKIPTLLQVNEVEEGDLLPAIFFSPPPQPVGSPVLLLAGSAPNLKPERATTWSGTLELHPRFVSHLNLRATYFSVDYRGRIASPIPSVLTALYNPIFSDLIVYNPTAAQVNAIIATLPGGLSNQTGAPFDPSGVGAIIDIAIRNTERQRIRGIDLDADYRVEFGGGGTLLLTGAASYLRSDQQLAPKQAVIQLAGTIFHPPHWRGRTGAIWDSKRAGLSAFVNYIGPRTDDRFTAVTKTGAFVTLDLNASLRTSVPTGLLRNLELRVSALNVLDAKPHRIRALFPEEAPYDSTNESPVGRYLGLSIRKVW